jgi:diacylglycerol kinase (ATP)
MAFPSKPGPGARILVLVNPTSGGGRAGKMWPHADDYLRQQGARADFVETTSSDEMRRRAAAAQAAGYSHVVALGGDGAFHYVMNGALGSGVVLGFFPCGNGNDIALGLGIPTEPIAAAGAFLRAEPRAVDVLRIRCAGGRESVFIGAGGTGLDAEAARLVHGEFKRLPGVVRYIASALWAFRTYQPIGLDVELDGERWSGKALLAAVANSPSYGAGILIEPAARMDDGWLNVVLVADLPWTRIVEALLPILRNGDLRWPEIERRRARRVRLESDRPAIFHGDGELLGDLPAHVEVVPRAIWMGGTKTR